MTLPRLEPGAGEAAVVSALRQALPYLSLFQGSTFVVKVGGALFLDSRALHGFLQQVAVLHRLGIHVVLVHGGGPQITRLAGKLGLETPILDGRRVTSKAALRVALMVLNGELNSRAVALFRELGVAAVGLSGADGRLITARKRPPLGAPGQERDFGLVGDIQSTDTGLLESLFQKSFLPVLSPISSDDQGRLLNVNADSVAARLAVDLGALKLILATELPGILEELHDPGSLAALLDLEQLQELVAQGAITGGMLPKAAAARAALEQGVPRVHIISALSSSALLSEVFTNEGSGTLIVARQEGCDGAA